MYKYVVYTDPDPRSYSVAIQQKKQWGARSYIYSKGHYQKVNLVTLAESYKKQQ